MKKLIASIIVVGTLVTGALTATSAFADGLPPNPMSTTSSTVTADIVVTPDDGIPPQPM